MQLPLCQIAIAAGLLWTRIICALVGGSQMSALQRRIATVSDMTANLIAELRELDRLREQVREALLSVRKSQQQKTTEWARGKIDRSQTSPWRISRIRWRSRSTGRARVRLATRERQQTRLREPAGHA